MRHSESVSIRLSSGEILRGDFRATNDRDDRAIVFVHGFASVRNGEKSIALEAACAHTGWTFAAFDCRGHGESDGAMRDLRPTRLIEDLTAIGDFLISRGIRKIGLVGSSMGGLAAAWFALKCDAAQGCVLIAPAFRFLEWRWESLSEFERAYWKQAGHVRYKNEFIDVDVGFGLMEERHLFQFEELVISWNKPALIFHGLLDDTVPVADSIEFQSRVPSQHIELRLFKNGDHRLSAFKDEMAAETCRYFSRLIR